jgi:predicted signal transduction protein with EAL and GGDEF domain
VNGETEVVNIGSKNLLIDAGKKLVAAVGVEDLIIIDTGDTLLIAKNDATQDVKKVVEKLRIENNIRKDLHHQQRGFSIAYQPQINIKTGRIVGVVALVRWTDTALGEINTETFISICEESNLIVEVDRYVLRQACLGINRINAEHPSPFLWSAYISVRN